MWEGEHGADRPYEGAHFHLERTLNAPQSLTRPHPPILLGGSGEKTLRLVARYADACNIRPGPDIPQKLATLRHYCDEEGRDYNPIGKGCPFPFEGGENGEKGDGLRGQLRWLASMGIETVIGMVPRTQQIKPFELRGQKVIPAVADL